MRFVKTIKEKLRITNYRLAKELGLPTQSVDLLIRSGKSIRPETLVRLRKLSGLSWSKFGSLLEREFK